MRNYLEHLISQEVSLKIALERLNSLGVDAILFVVDKEQRLIGSLTDGDVRRGLLKGWSTSNNVSKYIQPNPKKINKNDYSITEIIEFRNNNFRIIPVVDDQNVVINIINFRTIKSYLPLDAIIMAGGRGSRLQPLTNNTPKPLLPVGNKPIIDHNVDRLCSFGIDDFHVSLNYLGQQIIEHYQKREIQSINMDFIWENEPLGTIGAASLIKDYRNKYVLITNSDILTKINYEDFFIDFLEKNADMSVASIPYSVNIPYAVLETQDDVVLNFKEKPTYTYYSNAGIYILKRELLELIPKNQFYNTTDLMETVIASGKKLTSYPVHEYWLDVGKHEDYEKAQQDIKHLSL